MSLMKHSFDYLPCLLSESAGQIAGLDPATWPQYEEPVAIGLYCKSRSFFVCVSLNAFLQ